MNYITCLFRQGGRYFFLPCFFLNAACFGHVDVDDLQLYDVSEIIILDAKADGDIKKACFLLPDGKIITRKAGVPIGRSVGILERITSTGVWVKDVMPVNGYMNFIELKYFIPVIENKELFNANKCDFSDLPPPLLIP